MRRFRYPGGMKYATLFAATLLAGCMVGGTPTAPCPQVIVYISTTPDTLVVADSVIYRPGCP